MGSIKVRRLLAGVGMVAVFTAGAGAAVTAQAGGSNAPGGGSAAPAPRAGAIAPPESGFVSMVPCRLFSSVTAGPGKFTPGQTRSINKGGDLSTQGGKAGGCGIPDDATALHVNITAPLAEGNGYIRVWPDASVEQPATFMNFSNAFNVSNAGTVDVDTGGGIDVMDLKVYNSRTHVIIDVLGYYVEPMIAVVSSTGTLVRGTAGAAVVKQPGTGSYRVEFDRNVQGCTLQANLGSTAGGFPPTSGTALAGFSDTAPQTDVYVETRNGAGTATDLPFHLTVTC